MKIKLKWFLVLVCVAMNTAAGNVSEPYTLATWPGFRQAAVSYTFDDLSEDQHETILSLFTEAGMGVTLFTTTNSAWEYPGWTCLHEAANKGHEIASHTASGISLTNLTMEEKRAELEGSRAAIDAMVTGQSCLTLAYPECVMVEDALVAEQYIAARVCSGKVESATPEDFLRIRSVEWGSEGSGNTLEDFQRTAASAADSGGWLVYQLRGEDDGVGDSSTGANLLLSSIEFFDEESGTYWVDTFGNVVRYIRERDNATVVELQEDENQIQISLSDTLDDGIYNFPLTLRRKLPDGWVAARATQNEQSLRSQVILGGDGLEVQFDAVPDAGLILIEKVDPSPRLSIRNALNAGQVRFQIEGVNGVQYSLLRSANLEDWTLVHDGLSGPAILDKPVGALSQYYVAAPSAIQSGGDLDGWNKIGAGHPFIEYSGRSIGIGTDIVSFGYSGARMRLRFEGDAVGMWMEDDSGDNYVMFWIDDEAQGKIRLDRNRGFYELANNLGPGPHTVEIVRLTECSIGLNHFQGFALKGVKARALEWVGPSDRRIEFIGDSITCGYGLEASGPSERFSVATENFSLTCAGLTARALGADYIAVCRSGIGVFRNFGGPYEGSENDILDVYPDLFYQLPEYGSWNPELYTPDVVCINLGTNDFSTSGGNVDTFLADYIAFGSMLLEQYTGTVLVIIQGPMNKSTALRDALDQVVGLLKVDYPGRVHFCELSGQGSVGYGASYHPNRAQSELNAGELTDFLAELMEWK